MNSLLSFIRRKILRIPADRWDYQYENGQWNNLHAESDRLNAVIELIRSNYKMPDILEIGCGEAIMLRQMNENDFSSFTGIDLSKVAIANAGKYQKDNIKFEAADMNTYKPVSKYDIIAFNESLYYAKDLNAVFGRYLSYLKDGGSVIVTAFQNKYTAHLWPSIERTWKPVHLKEVTSGDHVWSIRLYQPQPQ